MRMRSGAQGIGQCWAGVMSKGGASSHLSEYWEDLLHQHGVVGIGKDSLHQIDAE